MRRIIVHRDLKITRRTALKGAAAAGIAGLGISPLFAQTNTKLTVTGYFRTPAFLVAQDKGLFTKERLDVEFHLVRLAPEHNQGLAEGRWPITLSSSIRCSRAPLRTASTSSPSWRPRKA
jgi:hypothetical protein